MCYSRVLISALYIVLSSGAYATTHEPAQTDWSGGPGIPGPVTDWGDTFDSSNDVSWLSFPGELNLSSTPLPTPVEHTVDGNFSGAFSVYSEDVDGDGDMDVLGAAFLANAIAWWENDDGSGTSWTKHTVDGDFRNARSVYSDDVDGDGDLDVLGASHFDDDITWWENDDGSGTSWTEHTINGEFNGASSVYSEDVDEDGDLDILGAAAGDFDITWWSNDDGSGTSWTEYIVDGDFGGYSVYSEDVDGDGDMDILGAAFLADDITWWENLDGSGTSWAEHLVDGQFYSAVSVYSADVDGDGDMDVLGASQLNDDITWWSNDDGLGTSWTEHTVDGNFDIANCVYSADVDGDGDMDVLGAAQAANDITWWSNDDGTGTAWTEHVVDGNFNFAISVYSEDVDGDGDMDVLGTSYGAHDIAWWEVTLFRPSGELTSSIYDTGGAPVWGQIDWTSDTPSDTTLKFQVRGSSDYTDMGGWSADITSPGSLASYLDDGDRYVQYKVIMETDDQKVTPTLYDVTIDWICTDIVVTALSADSAADGVEVSWECADAVSGFNVYRTTDSDLGNAVVPRDKLNADLITGESPYAYLDASVKEGITYSYWLEAVEISGAAETFGPVECTWNGALPTTYALYQSRPNPATGSTIIAFDLPEDAKVTLTVYDISGRKVTTVVNETLTIGTHERTVAGLAPGVYVYRLNAGSFSAAKKMVIVE